MHVREFVRPYVSIHGGVCCWRDMDGGMGEMCMGKPDVARGSRWAMGCSERRVTDNSKGMM